MNEDNTDFLNEVTFNPNDLAGRDEGDLFLIDLLVPVEVDQVELLNESLGKGEEVQLSVSLTPRLFSSLSRIVLDRTRKEEVVKTLRIQRKGESGGAAPLPSVVRDSKGRIKLARTTGSRENRPQELQTKSGKRTSGPIYIPKSESAQRGAPAGGLENVLGELASGINELRRTAQEQGDAIAKMQEQLTAGTGPLDEEELGPAT